MLLVGISTSGGNSAIRRWISINRPSIVKFPLNSDFSSVDKRRSIFSRLFLTNFKRYSVLANNSGEKFSIDSEIS